MPEIKIRIKTKKGKWVDTKAIPTSHPLLFVHPAWIRIGEHSWFSQDEYGISHTPSGCSIYSCLPLDMAKRLAEFFATSRIPWKKLRYKSDAKKYRKQYRAVMDKFWKVERVCVSKDASNDA